MPFDLVPWRKGYIPNISEQYLVALIQNEKEHAKEVVCDLAIPYVKSAFKASPTEILSSSSNFLFSLFSSSLPYALEALKISKLALQIMLSDVFEAFIRPLEQTVRDKNFPLEGGLALGMLGASLITHEVAVKYLKEDPKQAASITYGAITGTIAAHVMDHDVCVGMLSGAILGLITDTAVSYLTSNSFAISCKNQIKKLHIRERAEALQKLASQIFPYLFFTLGTALVYSRINPVISKMLEGDIPSQKIHVLKVIAASGMIFGTMKSYAAPLALSLLGHLKISLRSAYDTGMIVSWAPRIITILYVTSLLSPHKNSM